MIIDSNGRIQNFSYTVGSIIFIGINFHGLAENEMLVDFYFVVLIFANSVSCYI
jgi:hypothetical protein